MRTLIASLPIVFVTVLQFKLLADVKEVGSRLLVGEEGSNFFVDLLVEVSQFIFFGRDFFNGWWANMNTSLRRQEF